MGRVYVMYEAKAYYTMANGDKRHIITAIRESALDALDCAKLHSIQYLHLSYVMGLEYELEESGGTRD